MVYLTFAPIEKNRRWTVQSGNTEIAEVRVSPDGRCTLKARGELCLDTVDAITMFMREVTPQS